MVTYSISKLEFIGALAWLYGNQGISFDNWDLKEEWLAFVSGGRTRLPEGLKEIWDKFSERE